MTNKATILLVDDRPANLIALDGLLSNDERVLMTAHSGKEALEILADVRIDLILLDVQMPDMNGFELAQILKANKETADIPIIFASAEKLDHASRMKGFEEGGIDYLFKPLDPEITRAKVSVLLEVQRQKKQLRDKNSQLEKSALLISNCADIVGVLDANSLVIEQMNPSFTRLLGYSQDEFLSRRLTDFLLTGEEEKLSAAVADGKGHLSFETRVRARDGSLKWLAWNVVSWHGKWFVNARDVTEIKQLMATVESNMVQLEAANRELESFSYSVSHDLRAPLRAIHGNALAMEEDCMDILDDMAKSYLKKVQDNAIRMDRLINDLLAFSRIGSKEVRKSPVEMGELVHSIIAEAGSQQPNKAKFMVGDLPDGFGDLSMIRVVWTNLVSNAIKYSSKKEDCRIEIAGRRRESDTEYYIRDNGAGFDMAYANKLFGTFQRLHDASDFEGVGIGLAIVQRIVLKHGGTIRANAAPGEGATFWFTLPLAPGSSSYPAAEGKR